MVVADRAPQERGRGEASAADGLALGFAQAAALVPGVSRNGATLDRRPRRRLHPRAGEPALAHGRAAGDRRRRRRSRASAARGAACRPSCAARWRVGVGASFASTLASQGLIRLVERDRSLWPYAAYRTGLAGAGR